jgi:hypothetical protein
MLCRCCDMQYATALHDTLHGAESGNCLQLLQLGRKAGTYHIVPSRSNATIFGIPGGVCADILTAELGLTGLFRGCWLLLKLLFLVALCCTCRCCWPPTASTRIQVARKLWTRNIFGMP